MYASIISIVNDRRFRSALRAREWKEQAAALKIQRAWYDYQDQFASLFLMRALLVQDMVDAERVAKETRRDRRLATICIQMLWRRIASVKRAALLRAHYNYASCVQRAVRGWVIRRRMKRFRHAWSNAVTIQRFIRKFLARIHHNSRTIQRTWWRHRPGSLVVHLRMRKEERRLRDQRRLYLRLTREAVRIQAQVRMLSARRLVTRLRAGRLMARIGRGFVSRVRVATMRREIRTAQVAFAVEKFIAHSTLSATNWINRARRQASVKMQSVVRQGLARKRFRKIRRRHWRRLKAATRIQCFVRVTAACTTFKDLAIRAKRAAKYVVVVVVVHCLQLLRMPFD
jgi:hypothetical protein